MLKEFFPIFAVSFIAVAASTAREWAQITILQTTCIAMCLWKTSWISVTK